jgi:hypothetical protein
MTVFLIVGMLLANGIAVGGEEATSGKQLAADGAAEAVLVVLLAQRLHHRAHQNLAALGARHCAAFNFRRKQLLARVAAESLLDTAEQRKRKGNKVSKMQSYEKKDPAMALEHLQHLKQSA